MNRLASGVRIAATLALWAAVAAAASPALAINPSRVRHRAPAAAPAAAPVPLPANPLDQPTEVAWPAVNSWSPSLEREYGEFVATLGRAIEGHRCRRLDECLRDPQANTLYDAGIDRHMTLAVDCADLPYILRAYFSFKRRLPFGFVADVVGRGRDPRYMTAIRPDVWRSWRDYATPRTLLHELSRTVHSGMYRTGPNIETADFYVAAVNRRAVHPGTVFYDPNGHVLTVTEVRADGLVHMIDGHPDGSLTFKRFGQAFVVGTPSLGGGFKDFRPIALRSGRLVRATNAQLVGFDPRAQYDARGYRVNNAAVTYHAWVRASLADGSVRIDPATEFREQVRALCRDVQDRAEAVEVATQAGFPARPHPAALPTNIYGTEGDWELYSTPSRDARLKASFRELREAVAQFPDTPGLARTLEAAWHEETARPECQVAYTNSAGAHVTLAMDVVLDRLFALSFDPYQCPELRWGAAPGTPEFASCHDAPDKLAWYRSEQRLRNQIDREYGRPTPLEFGPATPPDVDVRRVIAARAAATPTTAVAVGP